MGGVCAAALAVTNCLLHLSHCCRESVVQLSRCCFTFVNNINRVTVLCTIFFFYNVLLLSRASPVFRMLLVLMECWRCAHSPHHSLEEELSQEKYTKNIASFFFSFQYCAFRFHAGICQKLLLIWFCTCDVIFFSFFTCCSKSVCAFQLSGS